jgi:hypothetical protein
MRFLKLTILALLLPLCMSAQKTEVGVFAGIMNYQGDFVGPKASLKDSGPALGLLAKYHLSNALAIRASFNIGQIKGDDANFEDNRRRDFSFESNLFDLSGAIEYSFFSRDRYDDGGTFKKGISPYLYIGLGIVNASPEVTVPDGKTLTSEELDASTLHFMVPIGGGLKIDLSETLTLGAEITVRPTFSDYLDGLSESANPDKDDWYAMGGLTLTYRLSPGNRNSVGN